MPIKCFLFLLPYPFMYKPFLFIYASTGGGTRYLIDNPSSILFLISVEEKFMALPEN